MAKVLLVVASVGLALLLWLWSESAQERAIRDMPAPERRALFLRTLENLKSVCKAPEGAMQDFCRNQARLVLDFPDCDDSCRRLAQEQLQPVRSAR